MKKKVSQKQIEANRINAQKNSGPKTKEGKTKSSMNAIKYGIYSNKILIKGEKQEDLETYRERILGCLKPFNEILFDSATHVIFSGWAAQRYFVIESKIINTKKLEEEKNKSDNTPQPITISWLDSPELEEKYEAFEEYKKNAPDNLEEKQKYLNDYDHDKGVAALRDKKKENGDVQLEEKLKTINNKNNNQKEYSEGLPDYLWNIDSHYKVNVILKRHLTNYYKALYSYFELEKKFIKPIDIQE
jgi:hypothetical protein